MSLNSISKDLPIASSALDQLCLLFEASHLLLVSFGTVKVSDLPSVASVFVDNITGDCLPNLSANTIPT